MVWVVCGCPYKRVPDNIVSNGNVNEYSSFSNCSVAEYFPEKPSWCQNEQVCQGRKCSTLGGPTDWISDYKNIPVFMMILFLLAGSIGCPVCPEGLELSPCWRSLTWATITWMRNHCRLTSSVSVGSMSKQKALLTWLVLHVRIHW